MLIDSASLVFEATLDVAYLGDPQKFGCPEKSDQTIGNVGRSLGQVNREGNSREALLTEKSFMIPSTKKIPILDLDPQLQKEAAFLGSAEARANHHQCFNNSIRKFNNSNGNNKSNSNRMNSNRNSRLSLNTNDRYHHSFSFNDNRDSKFNERSKIKFE